MSLVQTLLSLMMLLVLFLVRKWEEKEQVTHRVMRRPWRVEGDKTREEGAQEITASLKREDPSLDSEKYSAGTVVRKDT